MQCGETIVILQIDSEDVKPVRQQIRELLMDTPMNSEFKALLYELDTRIR